MSFKKFFFGLVFFALESCYTVRQALRQNAVLNSKKPIYEILEDPKTDKKTKEKLGEVAEILSFAKKEKLNVDGAYLDFIETPKEGLSHLMFVAKSDELKLLTWKFPIVGEVSYLGFFEKKERDDKIREYQDEGFDTAKGQAQAFSSLGFFSDPVYSHWLKDSRLELAHMLFHELTHRTLWLKSSTKMNENMSEFVADICLEKFAQHYNLQEELKIFYEKKEDDERLKNWIKSLKDELERSYKNLTNKAEILKAKTRLTALYKSEKKPQFSSKSYETYFSNKTWNHAEILSAGLYLPHKKSWEVAYQCFQKQEGLKTAGEFLSWLEVKLSVYKGEDDETFTQIFKDC